MKCSRLYFYLLYTNDFWEDIAVSTFVNVTTRLAVDQDEESSTRKLQTNVVAN